MSDRALPAAVVARGRRQPGERLTPELVLVCPELAHRDEDAGRATIRPPSVQPAGAPVQPLQVRLPVDGPLNRIARPSRSAAEPVGGGRPVARGVAGHGRDRAGAETRARRARLALVCALAPLVVAIIGAPVTSALKRGIERAPAPIDVASPPDTGPPARVPPPAADPAAGAVDRAVSGQAVGQRRARSAVSEVVATPADIPGAGARTGDAAAPPEGKGSVRTTGSTQDDVDRLEQEEDEPTGIPGVRPPTGPLFAPDAGVRVIAPPTLSWEPVANVRGYRLQLFRRANLVLEERVARPRFELQREWRFAGRRFTLTSGPYRWYVWRVPAKATAPSEGKPLKASSFTLLARAG